MFKISVLASGSGSTLDSLAKNCYDSYDGMLYGLVQIERVVVDRECRAMEVADQWDIPKFVIPRNKLSRKAWSKLVLDDFDTPVNLHVMAGFLSRLHISAKNEGRVVNIHPSMLPLHGGKGMYGLKVHESVIAAKDQITGISVHTATNVYDDGILLGQLPLAVMPFDTAETLMERVQKHERLFYPRVILNYLMKLPR